MTLSVTSGFRDPDRNQRVGGAKHSKHLEGKALDIDVSGFSEDERLRSIRHASALGFGGIGVYKDTIHIDTGRRRAWGPSHKFQSIPEWALPTIQGHMSRMFKV